MNLNKIASSILLCSAITIPSLLTPAIAAVADSAFKNVGYMPTYRAYAIDQIEFAKLTHVMYSFARPDAQGNIVFYSGGSAEQLTTLRTKAQTAGTKVGIALGGWDDDHSTAHIFENLTADSTTRAQLVTNIVDFTKQNQADGIDMDWEHPTATSANNYALFMQELADALHAENLFLSAAVVSYGPMGAHVHDSVLEKLDFLNLMAYDAQGTSDGHHSSMQVAIDSVTYWKGRGIDPKKIVLGVPFYSRGTAIQTYAQIVTSSADNACIDNADGKMYNGIPTIRKKTQYAIDNIGGIMNWELGQDSFTKYSLLSAMDDVINQVDDTICGDSQDDKEETPETNGVITYVVGSTAVVNGDIVLYNDSCYQAKNSPGVWSEPGTSSWFWDSATCPVLEDEDNWAVTKSYAKGDEVTHNDLTYIAVYNGTGKEPGKTNYWKQPSTATDWVTTTPYLKGTEVTHNGLTYVAVYNGTGKEPGKTNYWKLLSTATDWVTTTPYLKGTEVTHNGLTYIAVYNGTGKEPGKTNYWKPLSTATDWVTTTPYLKGTEVTHNGLTYIAVYNGTGKEPGKTNYWQEIIAGDTSWISNRFYTKADEVTHNGMTYRAKWNSIAKEPGKNNYWINISH